MRSLITRLLLATALVCSSAGAQPVTKIVVPFAAGGTTDSYVRLLATGLTEALGTPVIVENKAGASGSIAASYAARSRPDGLTMFLGANSTLVNNTVVFENLTYDPLKDFAPVSRVADMSMVFVGRTDLPYSNLKEMVAYAKANPGKINRGSPGLASGTNLPAVLFERVAGIQTTHVPFNGDAAAVQALLSGTIDIHSTVIASALPHVQSSKLRVLGVSGSKRLAQVPNVPTFKESGYDLEADAWFSLVVPAGTPREAIDRLNKAVNQVLAKEDFIAKARAMGLEPRGSSPEELGKHIRAEHDRWVPLLMGLNLPKS